MAVQRNDTAGDDLTAALGGQPPAGDDVQIDNGKEIYDTNCDIDTNEINSFTVTPGFAGELGVAGTPVELNLAGSSYDGKFLYDGAGGGGYFAASSVIADANVRRTNRGTVRFTAGTLTSLGIDEGLVDLLTGVVATTVEAQRASMKMLANATAITTARLYACRNLLIKRGVTTAEWFDCDARFDNRSYALATLTLYRSGLWYNGGNMTNLKLLPGSVLDLRGLTQNLTITDATLWNGAEIIFPEFFTVTFTNTPSLPGGGPKWYNG